MNQILIKGGELYAALAAGDADVLRDLLTDNFCGELTEGLPEGLGGRYEGRDVMMAQGWGAVGALFDMGPQVAALYDAGDVLIARGHYVGKAKTTGKPVRAAFAHFWTFDGGRFGSVTQVTDSGLWRDALQ